MISAGIMLTLAWGALAFGATYPWAYLPLLALSAIVGSVGLLYGRRPLPTRTLLGLGLLGLAAALQAVPLPRSIVFAVSPASESILLNYDLAYALGNGVSRVRSISISPQRTALAMGFLVVFGALLAGTTRSATRESVRSVVLGIIGLGAVIAVVAVVQKTLQAGVEPKKIYGFWTPLMGRNPFGPFVNRNHFAGWMLMAIPLGLGMLGAMLQHAMRGVDASWRERLLWFASPDANKMLLVGFALLAMSLSLVLAGSRSGILALGVAMVVSAAFALRQATATRRMIGVAYSAFVVMAVLGWVGVDTVVANFNNANSVSFNGRLPIWRDTLQIVRDFWLTGTGLNTYGIATLFYQRTLPTLHLAEAHNDYLQLAAEGGLLLAVPIAIAVVAFALDVRRRFRASPGSSIYWIRMGAVTGIAAVALQSLVEFSLQMPGNAALFTVLCGIALHDADRVRA